MRGVAAVGLVAVVVGARVGPAGVGAELLILLSGVLFVAAVDAGGLNLLLVAIGCRRRRSQKTLAVVGETPDADAIADLVAAHGLGPDADDLADDLVADDDGIWRWVLDWNKF